MKGYIYKLVCEKSQKIYYGSTFNEKMRENKGWYKCSCKDFVNPLFSIIEEVEVKTKNELRLIENKYIIENECVNKNVAIRTKETDKEYYKKYRETHREQMKNSVDKYRLKVLQPIICPFCDCMTSQRHINRHQKSNKCFKTYKILW
tara:strand:+ start:6394 stop:6834 length:441 start_codon:yes stop_codon:yes gene_type:complete